MLNLTYWASWCIVYSGKPLDNFVNTLYFALLSMVYIFGSVLCGASVLSLSCQGQGRVSHWWSLWCSPTLALSSAFFLSFFSSVFTSLAPFSTPCTCITLTGNVQSIYWFLMLFSCRSIGIHLMFLQDALLLSVCLAVCLLPPLYFTSLSLLSIPMICNDKFVVSIEQRCLK